MNKPQLNILLVDENEHDYITIRHLLSEIEGQKFNLEWVTTHKAALERMGRRQHDIYFLNGHLGKGNGLELLYQAVENSGRTPLILLTEPGDHKIISQAMAAGATDYLIKGQIDALLLERSIRYAIQCRQNEEVFEQQVRERMTELIADNEKLRQEIADLNRTVQVLRMSEQQYRRFFDNDVDGVEVSDEQGKIVDCNATYQRLLGYSRAEIIDQQITAFLHDNSKLMFEQKLALVKEQGYADSELELLCKDGSTIIVWRKFRALYDEAGVFVGMVTYNRDITERVKVVKQISTLTYAIEQSPTSIMVTDTTGNIEYVNLRFTEITGYSFDEVVGRNPRILKSDQQSPDDFKELWETIAAGDEWQGELCNRRKSGEIYWTSTAITPLVNPNGVITHYIAVQEDITDRKEAEAEAMRSQRRVGDLMSGYITDLTEANEALQREIAERKRVEEALYQSRARLRAQYKSIPVPTYSWQRVGNDFALVDYNDAAAQTIQGNIVNFMGKTASEVFKDRPQVLADFARCFNEKVVIKREAPYKLLTTGETRHFVTSYIFVPPNLVIVYIEDISEVKQAKAELEKHRKQYETLQQEISAGQPVLLEGVGPKQANGRSTEAQAQLEKLTTELAEVNEALQREIAAREKAEKTLRESEERLELLAGNVDNKLREQYRGIPIPTYSWQMIAGEFVLIDFNDAAARAMGRIVDFLGKTANEIFKDRPEVLADFSHCYEIKSTLTREALYTLVTTGETRYFRTTYVFIPPNLVIDHIEDITEQKQMEEELKRYRELYDELNTDHTTELTKATQELQRETNDRRQVEKAMYEAKAELVKYRDHIEELVKERTAELVLANEQLQREVLKHERAEESFRESRVRLRTQYKNIPVPTYSWQRVGNDFVLIDYNDAAEHTSRGRIVDFMGKTAQNIFKERPQVLADFEHCYREKTIVKREAPYQLITTGEIRYFITTYIFMPPNLVVVYMEDITAYKQLEEALQLSEGRHLIMAQEQTQLICYLSPEKSLTFVNDAYCWYFNQKRKDLLGRSLPFILDEDREKVEKHLASLSPENPVGAVEYRVVKPNGDIRWQQWINRAIFDKQGHLIEFQTSGLDVSRRKELEKSRTSWEQR